MFGRESPYLFQKEFLYFLFSLSNEFKNLFIKVPMGSVTSISLTLIWKRIEIFMIFCNNDHLFIISPMLNIIIYHLCQLIDELRSYSNKLTMDKSWYV